ncbi:DUF4278 domain-containing protein [Leptolyngbya sp. PCC 6406]|uniref:DUF4278 domain-containing protein n=1 Tax=Leptolyngbya sp. PCC 6406 TaxID=1173264 RepID=UPI0002ABD9AE|nr:DUF4278 domain-containing protein [Leptolyngbya sp. PCC 6406]
MKLFYRGHQYETNPPHLEADAVEEIGTYRGAPFKRNHFPAVQNRSHGQVQLTYRGVKYSQDV